MAVVLIAEDNQDVCALLERLLTRAGFTVLTAPDGMAALKTPWISVPTWS
jgi:DNA-binding response OmpR family regulator